MPDLSPQAGEEEVLILVKALPHVSEGHGEIVCCAGVTRDLQWRRLFPIKFRQLAERKFARWQWINYHYRLPRTDRRPESRRVQVETIELREKIRKSERLRFLADILVGSTSEATDRGETLALVRPTDWNFSWSRKTDKEVDAERVGYEMAARQASFLDDELRALEPCPYKFSLAFTDRGGPHRHICDDWETAAMFYRFRQSMGDEGALNSMSKTFNEDYKEKGMALVLGTHSRWPSTWLLVGIVRLDESPQLSLGRM